MDDDTGMRSIADGARSGPLRVLVVDDDADVRALVRHVLQAGAGAAGVDVTEVGLLEPAVALVEAHDDFDAIVLDLETPDADRQPALYSVTRMLAVQSEHDASPVIVLTGRHEDLGAQSVRLGAEDFVRKAELVSSLYGTVERALERRARDVRARQQGWRQLRAAAQLEQLAADMTSHVRAPLATAMIGLETVADRAGELEPERQQAMLHTVREQLSRLDQNLTGALERVMASRTDERVAVSVRAALDGSLERFSARDRDRLTIRLHGDRTIWGRPGAVEDTLAALLRDALHRSAGQPVRFDVDVSGDDGEVVLTVSDDAPPHAVPFPDRPNDGPPLWERIVALNAASMGGWLRSPVTIDGRHTVAIVLPQRGRVGADAATGRRLG